MTYVGRFAPSPSGRLHFGSLVCALGSYLRAKSLGGRILLRIEDTDTSRCHPDNTLEIIDELSRLGFVYDGKVRIQTEHLEEYYEQGLKLYESGYAYYCSCTRDSLKRTPCQCVTRPPEFNRIPCALRLRLNERMPAFFYDVLRGYVACQPPLNAPTLIRKDGLVSYNLACVADDLRQGVNEVVRGADLMEVTTTQQYLSFALGAGYVMSYLHLPLVMADDKHKLSKQNHAIPVLDEGNCQEVLLAALRFLGQSTCGISVHDTPRMILNKALSSFDVRRIPLESGGDPLR